MTCPNCGGRLEGDGYTVVFHCERIECPADVEPDANPVYCEEIEDENNQTIS
jgi:tRNA(Ile2) C34 agmatinyltransferase TiaS